MTDAATAPLVENRYRAALVAARAEVAAARDAVEDAVRLPRRTLALAWRCRAAAELAAALGLRHRRSLAAVEAEVAELDVLIAQLDPQVRGDSWQARWRPGVDTIRRPVLGADADRWHP